MASILSPLPRLVFSVVEPISLIGGFCGAISDPAWFISEQIPQSTDVAVNGNSIMVAWQLGNLYLLMALLGVAVLHSTSEPKVVRGYLFALWLGDIGHVGFSAYGLGMDKVMNPLEWNAMTGGNIAFTIFLFVMRSAYFLGMFGPDQPAAPAPRKHE